MFAAGIDVKLAAFNGRVPVKFAAGKAVRFAPEPLLKVPTPVTDTRGINCKTEPTIPSVPDMVTANFYLITPIFIRWLVRHQMVS